MPRGFTDQEKARIQKDLLSVGRKMLKTLGVRKTTVEDLAYSVNISKGAFYKFYESKEALFFAVVEEMEDGIKQNLAADLINLDPTNAEGILKATLKKLMRSEEALVFTSFHEDVDQIMLGIGQHTITQHDWKDLEKIREIFAVLSAKGIRIYMTAEKAVAFSRALFWILTGRKHFESVAYDEVIDSIVDKFIEECLREKE